jgi:hypothetical protein
MDRAGTSRVPVVNVCAIDVSKTEIKAMNIVAMKGDLLATRESFHDGKIFRSEE